MTWRISLLYAIAALTFPMAANAIGEPDSPAQVALFDSDHLKNIASPVHLTYSFVRSGSPDVAYDDKVIAEIREVHPDGAKDVWITFLSGERQMPAAPVVNFHGNPLLMYFLEHDVLEMKSETGVPATYFRNRIRQAFFNNAQTSQTTIDFGGHAQPATQIDISPFAKDPNLAPMPAVAGKTYRFVLCDQVPGTIYQIGSRMPPTSGQASVDEVMTYSGETP